MKLFERLVFALMCFLIACQQHPESIPVIPDYAQEQADYLLWLESLPISDEVRWMIRENKHCVAQHAYGSDRRIAYKNDKPYLMQRIDENKHIMEIHSNKRYVYHLVITEITSEGLNYHYLCIDDLLLFTTPIYDSVGYDMAKHSRDYWSAYHGKLAERKSDSLFLKYKQISDDVEKIEKLLNTMALSKFDTCHRIYFGRQESSLCVSERNYRELCYLLATFEDLMLFPDNRNKLYGSRFDELTYMWDYNTPKLIIRYGKKTVGKGYPNWFHTDCIFYYDKDTITY